MSPLALFLRPGWWPALLLAPAAWGLLLLAERASARGLRSLAGPRVALLAGPGRERRALRAVLFAAALLLAAAALLEPAWGAGRAPLDRRGADVVLCLDVSRSMRAQDLAPDRLGRAQAEIASFAGRAAGDRVGLVVFAGEARVVSPLTHDLRSLAQMALAVDTTSVERGGTDLGAAVEAALRLLEAAGGDDPAIVLLTDGEDLEGRGLRAARAAGERRVPVHVVAVGSALGGKVPLAAEGGSGFLRDRSGSEVVSAMDASGLERIAEASGGGFVEAAARTEALASLHESRILPAARTSSETGARRGRESRFQWPLAAALALWLLDLALAGGRRR